MVLIMKNFDSRKVRREAGFRRTRSLYCIYNRGNQWWCNGNRGNKGLMSLYRNLVLAMGEYFVIMKKRIFVLLKS